MCQQYNIYTTSYHFPPNGKVEKFHKTHQNVLSAYVVNDEQTWLEDRTTVLIFLSNIFSEES